ncbi:TetR family transcriptional regulator [Ideonella sp.]|uniref:TetR family transcriptional regulator n=1 Tax=Ideonella sp. TaxID=1929293 RepID=UPI0035B29424
MVRRTKADALATRHQILDAAEAEFLARGVAHTRLQDVAAAAGVTRGAIYWHFQDKAELFNAMMERALLPCEGAAEHALRIAGDNPLAQLHEMAVAPLRVMAESEQVQRVFRIAMHQTEYTAELAPVQERYLEGIGEFQQQLADALQRADALGWLRPGLPLQAIALGLFALVDGLMHHWTLRPGGFDLVAYGEVTVRAYVHGLRAALPQAAPATATPPAAPAPRLRAPRSRPAPST